jgi:hypothetical protein
MRAALGDAILVVHFVIIVFNIAGLVVIPLGAALGWRFVRIAWLRLLHLGILVIVAGQALLGRACILAIWQNELTGNTAAPEPIVQWLDGLIYWNFPIWMFAIFYSVIVLYVVALTVFVPFGRWARS